MLKFILFGLLFHSTSLFAQTERHAHLLAVGQGVSSPSVTTTLIYSDGATGENPVGVLHQEGLRLSLAGDQDSEAGTYKGFGGELGYAKPGWGLAAGYYNRDCDSCEGITYGAAAVEFENWISVGLKASEEIQALGLLLNSSANFRLGITTEFYDPEGENNNITSYGLGFAFVAQDFTFVVDASTRTYEDTTNTDETIEVTPGLFIHVGMIQISLNYRLLLNEDETLAATNNEEDDHLWLGIGLGDKDWHVAYYSKYIQESALEVSFFF